MLNDLLALYQGTNEIAPVAKGLKTYDATGDCDCVDGDCCNCD